MRVTVFRDMRLDDLVLPRCEVVEIDSASQRRDEFERRAATADRVMIVAPEFDGILADEVRRADSTGDRSLNASHEFVAIAADKHRTAARLTNAGVPAPAGRLFGGDECKLPDDFEYPAVLKPVDGAGSQNILLLHGPRDEPPSYPWARRLERLCPGRPASVAALCGPNGRTMLPPCWQRLSDDGRFTYRGGSLIAEPGLARRATALAERALDAMPPSHGFVGVDLVLGADALGGADVAIEINPRLTTSYVGLRAAVKENLAQLLLNVTNGQTATVTRTGDQIEFTATGSVWTT
jgi:predicted ATP-grasp superfamily ATP-dependent carboligase